MYKFSLTVCNKILAKREKCYFKVKNEGKREREKKPVTTATLTNEIIHVNIM